MARPFDTSGKVWATLDGHDDPYPHVWGELTPEMRRRVRALGVKRFEDVRPADLAQIIDDCRTNRPKELLIRVGLVAVIALIALALGPHVASYIGGR